MNTIMSQEELLEAVRSSTKVIVCERYKVARVITRFLQRNGLDEKIAAIAVAREDEKGKKTILGKDCASITEFQNEKDALFLVTQLRGNRHLDAVETIKGLGITNYVEIDYEVYAACSQEENPHMDFACVAFTKCGTTSLSAAFRRNKSIFMPKGKETFYLHWRNKYDDSPKKFREKYFSDVPEGKLIGNIEPSYHPRARDVYECFGKDVKIIFMMRNPAGATFSYYKMMVRRPREMEYVDYYKKYGKYAPEMFTDFLESKIFTGLKDRFKYDIWIKEYLEYFPKEQIKCIFLEDLITDPEKVMDEVQDFIQPPHKKKYKSLPHNNEGSFVSKNYLSAYINYRYYWSIRNKKENAQLSVKKRMFNSVAAKLQKHTTVENNDKMTPEQKELLLDFYKESIQEVEKLCGRSLKELWGYK